MNKRVTGDGSVSPPDAITKDAIIEVKDTKVLNFTSQIRAQRNLAKDNGKKYIIYTGKNTKISQTIKDDPSIEIRTLDYLGPK